jgi:hypothetical protein
MTNAIVIGVPDASIRGSSGTPTQRPTAVKSNSINFVYHGDGLNDFFLDGVSLQDRLASEVKVVGNTKEGTKPDEVDQAIRAIGNIPDDEDPLVFYSGDGGIYFFTKGYEDDSERHVGDVSKIFINGKPLSEIIGTSSSMDSRLDEYKTKVNVQAAAALGSVTNANNLSEIKAALTTFFTNIQDN